VASPLAENADSADLIQKVSDLRANYRHMSDDISDIRRNMTEMRGEIDDTNRDIKTMLVEIASIKESIGPFLARNRGNANPAGTVAPGPAPLPTPDGTLPVPPVK
jgi:hypothetical protein